MVKRLAAARPLVTSRRPPLCPLATAWAHAGNCERSPTTRAAAEIREGLREAVADVVARCEKSRPAVGDAATPDRRTSELERFDFAGEIEQLVHSDPTTSCRAARRGPQIRRSGTREAFPHLVKGQVEQAEVPLSLETDTSPLRKPLTWHHPAPLTALTVAPATRRT